MKKAFIILAITAWTLLSFTCNNESWEVYIENLSDREIIIYSPFAHPINHYPDTTLSFRRQRSEKRIEGKESYIFTYYTSFESLFSYLPADTLSIYFFDVDTIYAYPWGTIQKEYKILQRYDLSAEDFEYLDYILTYPPSKKMRYMKMYPPFHRDERFPSIN